MNMPADELRALHAVPCQYRYTSKANVALSYFGKIQGKYIFFSVELLMSTTSP